jgi:hypothetical protein
MERILKKSRRKSRKNKMENGFQKRLKSSLTKSCNRQEMIRWRILF